MAVVANAGCAAMAIYDPIATGCMCEICPLRGKKFVPPKGSHSPELVIVGEAPHVQEEKRREPFVGAAGILLDEMLRAIGTHKSKLWVSHTILCRPDTPGVIGSKRYLLKTYLAWLRLQNASAKKEAKKNKTQFFPVSSPLECCAPRLWRELNHFENVARQRGDVNGIVIVPMGQYAMKAITGKKVGILKIRGSPILLEQSQNG